MAFLLAIERFIPPYRYSQEVVMRWVRSWLEEDGGSEARRLLSVYESAGVQTRGSVVPIESVFHPGDLESQNDRYAEAARVAACDVACRALDRARLTPRDVDLVVSVSCTGFMIPAVEAYIADALGMGPKLARLPITESGCAGGVVGLARAADFLSAHPRGVALVVAVEFASLTFQHSDRSAANIVSAAIFGDGGAAVVLVGRDHPLAASRALASLSDAESLFFPGTTGLMGFRLRNQGLQIVLDRGLAPFLRREVGGAVDGFLSERGLARRDVSRWMLHPGGRRVVEVMAEQLGLGPGDLHASEAVLAEHGNMSSATVLFVLDEVLRNGRPAAGERGLLGAFGPGFGAELALLQFW